MIVIKENIARMDNGLTRLPESGNRICKHIIFTPKCTLANDVEAKLNEHKHH